MECERGDPMLVPDQAGRFLARGSVPDLDDLVPAGRGDVLAVGAERRAVDAVTMAGTSQRFLAADTVPAFRRVADAGRDQPPAVRAESNDADRLLVPAERVNRLAGRQIPEQEVAAVDRVPASPGEETAVGAVGHRYEDA